MPAETIMFHLFYFIHSGEIEFKEAGAQWPACHFDFSTLMQPKN
jgi:hypothetical protein